MIHLGDITKINGADIEPVDCMTYGSPCQDCPWPVSVKDLPAKDQDSSWKL